MKNLVHSLARQFPLNGPLHGYHLTRALIGVTLIFYFVGLIPQYENLIGPESLFQNLESSQYTSYLPALLAVNILLALLLTLGWNIHLTIPLLIVTFSLFTLSTHLLDFGWREFLPIFLIYLWLLDSGSQLSIQKNRRELSLLQWYKPQAFFLYKVHLIYFYLFVAISRIHSPVWTEGNAVINMLTKAMWIRLPLEPILQLQSILTPLGYLFWWIELLAPILFFTRFKNLGVYALIIMHVGIELSLNIGYWSYIMISLLVGVLWEPELENPLKTLFKKIRPMKKASN